MILDIPIEILNVAFRIEKDDPLKPLMDIVTQTTRSNPIRNLYIV